MSWDTVAAGCINGDAVPGSFLLAWERATCQIPLRKYLAVCRTRLILPRLPAASSATS